MMSKKRILCVGLVCLDVVLLSDGFPQEDDDFRCLEQWWQTGGNAGNNCTVLSMLGVPCELLATMAARGAEVRFIKETLESNSVAHEKCVHHPDCQSPVSVIILNKQSASRTILHTYKNLPELTHVDFMSNIDLTRNQYGWIHFEGRTTVGEIKQMLHHVDLHNQTLAAEQRITTSVEIEQALPHLDELCGLADFVFVSKEHASMVGHSSKEATVEGYVKKCRPGASVICAWGEDGAAARGHNGVTLTCPSCPPPSLVDTLGAGDTFIAAAISVLSDSCQRHGDECLQQAIERGCRVAGAKCGIQGYKGLKTLFPSN